MPKRLVLFLLLLMGIISDHSAQLSTTEVSNFEQLLAQRKIKSAQEYLESIYARPHLSSIEKSHAYLLFSKIYLEQLQFEKAEKILDSLIKANAFLKYPDLLAETWFQKGSVARYQNKDADVVECFLRVDSISEKTNSPSKVQIQALTAIGGLMFQWRYMKSPKSFSKPSQYYEKALLIAERIGDSAEWYNVKTKLAFLEYGNPKNKKETISPIFEEAIAYFKKRNDIKRLMGVYQIFPKVHIVYGNLEEAETLYLKYIQLAQQNDMPHQQAIALWQYGVMLDNSGKTTAAIEALEKAEKILAKEKPLLSPINYTHIMGELARLYRNTGRFEESVHQLEQFYKTKDSLDGLAQMENFKELDTKYQTAEKDKAITQLQLKNQQKNIQILLLLLFVLLIASATFFYFYRQKQKINLARQLSELDGLKRNFFANISHEFRTPLTLIKSPVQHLRSKTETIYHKELNLIDSNANRMLELVDQLLELSKINSGELQIILKKANLGLFLHSIIEPFEFKAKEAGIAFEVKISTTPDPCFFDKDIFTKIVVNLVLNAFKYHDPKTTVTFHSLIKNGMFHFEVSNKNASLKENDLKKMFERFYQKNSSSTGSGIGLALVKNLVNVYGGTITPQLKQDILTISVTLQWLSIHSA